MATTPLSAPLATIADRPVAAPLANAPSEVSRCFRAAFGVGFSVLDGSTGDLLHLAPEQPARDWGVRGELAREVARRGAPEIIETSGPLVTLAVPVSTCRTSDYVAMAMLVCERPDDSPATIQAAGELTGLDADDARAWLARQPVCAVDVLLRIADLARNKWDAERRLERLEAESALLAERVAENYDEVSLLYCLIQHLRVTAADDDLARLALEWLGNVAPSQGLGLLWADAGQLTAASPQANKTQFIARGRCPLDQTAFGRLMKQLNGLSSGGACLINPSVTAHPDWNWPGVASLVVARIASADRHMGWLAAFNRNDRQGFTQIEANLFNSVATILGIHRENRDLFHAQDELVTGVVHALSTAIEAKDAFTCGHSDRVAQIAVRLGEELGCNPQELKSLYLAGLLHDVGKIGVDDQILRRPDGLTADEYEHVKQHPRIGAQILADLKHLDQALPVVLHHHEAWNGTGYPDGLRGEAIPRLARIVAVADAFDAMASQRPYRPHMPLEEIELVLRQGSGEQWDPQVISAFFAAESDIVALLQQASKSPQSPSTTGWT